MGDVLREPPVILRFIKARADNMGQIPQETWGPARDCPFVGSPVPVPDAPMSSPVRAFQRHRAESAMRALAFRLSTARTACSTPSTYPECSSPTISRPSSRLCGSCSGRLASSSIWSRRWTRSAKRVADARYDLLLMDLNYARDTTSGREGLDLLTEIHARDRGLPIVVMTGWGNIDTAVDAMRRGARSFVQKPWDNAALLDVVTREVSDGRRSRSADVRARHDQDEATQIQRALLPATLPSIATPPRTQRAAGAPACGCDVAAIWRPAEGLGGDWYDALRFGDNRVGLAIADVIGKGLPAALLMANLQASVRALASEDTMPRDVAAGVNRLLCWERGLRQVRDVLLRRARHRDVAARLQQRRPQSADSRARRRVDRTAGTERHGAGRAAGGRLRAG